MRKATLQSVRANFPGVVGFLFFICTSIVSSAQQHIIDQKDNTRPEVKKAMEPFTSLGSFTVTSFSGYNEIRWQAMNDNTIRGFSVEYSYEGKDFIAAGTPVSNGNLYEYRHYRKDSLRLFYRLRVEKTDGQFFYSKMIESDGPVKAIVRVYPTVVTGDVVNVIAQQPVERIIVTSGNGTQAFVKEVAGQSDYIPVAVPSLGKGMYFITFYGRGWKETSKFIME